jgi:hypothetical protein
MLNRKALAFLITGLMLISGSCSNNNSRLLPDYKHNVKEIQVPEIPFRPESYVCYMTDKIIIDGLMEEDSWNEVPWTANFVDIEGPENPEPLYQTRAKMLWDNDYFYIAAEIIEPHIYAKLRQRDTVIFYDNDFEVFIDPDGDSHGYYELEINALNTVWDLLLTMPYRDPGNHVIDAWDIKGLLSAVNIIGSLNNPDDIDEKWTVEIAIPIDVLSEWGPEPSEGLQWRVNFSRVNWRTINNTSGYTKELNQETGKPYPEYNWVWSPQGIINMHYPEMWGIVQFTETLAGESELDFNHDPDDDIKWELRKVYYAQRAYAAKEGVYTSIIEKLNKISIDPIIEDISILIKPTGYEAYYVSEFSGITWTINNHGRVFPIK